MRRRLLRVLVAASAALTVGVMPVFLVGALSDDLGEELGFGSARAGVAITIFFAVGALTAIPMGRVTDRVGAAAAMRVGVAISGVSALTIGTVVTAWWQLAVVLGVAGCAIGLIDTGGARSFADAIRAERHGVAFGVKEASVPAASMLAGLSIPLLAQRLGWEWVFVVAALGTPAVWVLVPGRVVGAPGPDTMRVIGAPRPPRIVVFAVGVAAAAAASSAAATLFVPAVTASGWSSDHAGLLLAAASVLAIGTRVGVGWVSDHAPGATWRLLAGAVALGALGAGALATGWSEVAVPGAALLLGAGWGWSGLAFLAAVRATPEAPATAAGIVLTGLASGGTAGPAAFGILASTWSYQVAWSACGCALAGGAALVAWAHPRTGATARREPQLPPA